MKLKLTLKSSPLYDGIGAEVLGMSRRSFAVT